MRRRVGLLAAALPALALWWLGRDPARTPRPETPAKPAPETIAQADIPTRADTDERFARDVITAQHGRDPTREARAALDRARRSMLEQPAIQAGRVELLSIRRLESLERHWGFFRKQLDAWRRDLNR